MSNWKTKQQQQKQQHVKELFRPTVCLGDCLSHINREYRRVSLVTTSTSCNAQRKFVFSAVIEIHHHLTYLHNYKIYIDANSMHKHGVVDHLLSLIPSTTNHPTSHTKLQKYFNFTSHFVVKLIICCWHTFTHNTTTASVQCNST